MTGRYGVTIAIPNWNHEVVLPRSVLSALRAAAVLREQGTPAEVLVIDDGSRDGSPPLLRQLEALHFADGLRVLAFGANRGLAASRNQALLDARFGYVQFLDADNELEPSSLPYLVRTLRQTGAAAAYGNLLVRTRGAEPASGVLSHDCFQPRIFKRNYIDGCALFDRQQVVDLGGYEATLPSHEDYELWLHLATNGRLIVFVPVVVAYYYVLPGSMLQETDGGPIQKLANRMFNQLGLRSRLPMATTHCKFHPDVGYL